MLKFVAMCVTVLVLGMFTGLYQFLHIYPQRKSLRGSQGWAPNRQALGPANASTAANAQRSLQSTLPVGEAWVFLVMYSGDDASAREAESGWFGPRAGVGRAAFGFYKDTTVECRSPWVHGTEFYNAQRAFLQAARCFPEGRFFARLNAETKTDLGSGMRFVEGLAGNASDYVGWPVESDGLVFASGPAGYVLSRESVMRLEACAPSPRWGGAEDTGVGECMQRAGVALTSLPSASVSALPVPDLCVVITFPETADPLKRLAHQNTANVYRALRPRVRAFLAQPVTPETRDWGLGVLDTPATNVHGTPLFGSLLLRVRDACPDTPLIAYANSDILFDAGLLETVDALLAWGQPEFLAVGRRKNHELKGALTIADVSTAHSELFLEVAQDYFILTRPLVDRLAVLPPYVIGRRAYDNALNDWAFHQSILVDLTETVTALHQTTSDGNFAGHSDGNPDKEYNVQLPGAVYDHGSTMHAQYATVRRDGKVVVLNKADNTVVASRHLLRMTRRGRHVKPEELPSPLLVVFGNAAYKEMLANFLCNTLLFPPMHAHTLVIVTDEETVGYLEALDSDATIGLFQHPMQAGRDYDTPDYVRLMLLRGRLLLSLLGERVVLWMEADAEYSGNLLEHPAVAGATTDLVLYWDGVSYGGGFVLFAGTQAARGFYAKVVERLEDGIARGDFTNDQVVLNDELRLQANVSRAEFDRCEFRSGRFYHQEFSREYEARCEGTQPMVQQHNWVVGNQNKVDMAKAHGAWYLQEEAPAPTCNVHRDLSHENVGWPVWMSNPALECFSVFDKISCQTLASGSGLTSQSLHKHELSIAQKQTPAGWPNGPVGPAFVRANGDIVLCQTGMAYGSAGCGQAGVLQPSQCPETAPQTVEFLVVISQYWGEGYFHMVVEGLTRLAQAMKEHQAFFDGSRQVYVHSLSPLAEQYARILGLGPVVSGDVLVTKQVVSSPPTPCGGHGWSPHARWLRSLVLPHLPPLSVSSQPLVVRRTGSRSILNHDELVAALGARVHTGTEPVIEQLRMFAESRLVVAPHGSGLANIIAMTEGAVVELQTLPANHCYLFLAVNLGLQYYGYYEDGATHGGSWGVNVQRLLQTPAFVQDSAAITATGKHKTEVVVFIPTPVPWEDRRAAVHAQFAREAWSNTQVVLLFILGTLETDSSKVALYDHAQYVRVSCYDQGDRPNEVEDRSATTCKVYEALKHVVARYDSRYVWRGADDTYLNLPLFFSKIMPGLPATRLYYGHIRRSTSHIDDLQLAHQPKLQELLGIIQFGPYMTGMGFLFSYDVADFVASLKIPPRLTWCEDVMVGMWLNPFQIRWVDAGELFYDPQFGVPFRQEAEYLMIHRMTPDQWRALP